MIIPKFVKKIGMEFLRYLVLGIIAYLISGGEIDRTVMFTMVLRIVDMMLHKAGKDEDLSWLIKGLTRF